MLALVVLASITAAAPPAVTLCIGDSCRAVDDAPQVAVRAAETPRPFVWISADEQRVVAGVIPAGASSVVVNDGAPAAHKVALVTADGARTVAPSFFLRCGATDWQWTRSQLPRGALTVAHPGGACTFRVSSSGYKSVEIPLADAGVATVYLHRLPVLSGEITDAVTKIPIARAEVLLPSGARLAWSDAQGRFREAIEGSWPAQIRVEAPGRATRIVSIPKAVADTHLPIVLSAGGTIALVLAPPLGEEDVSWEARRVIDQWKDEVVRTGQIPAGQTTAVIDALEAGTYRVVLKGTGPLQRVAQPVEVLDGLTSDLLLSIEPARLELQVTRAGQPLGDARIEFSYGGGAWRSTVVVDGAGEAFEEIWQQGPYLSSFGIWSETKEIREEGTVRWTLAIPDRAVRGRVIDAVTRQPVSGAAVVIDASSGMTRVTTGADGSYAFEMLRTGFYSLSVEASGYQNLRATRASLSEDEALAVHDLPLHPARGRSMRAVTGLGIPVVGALVYVSTRSGVRPAGLTDASGRAVVPVEQNEHGSLFVLPRSGSLAATRFAPAAEAEGDEWTVVVPEGTASLEMLTETTDGDPLGGVAYIMRINGILLPMEVKEEMQGAGVPLVSDAKGKVVLSRMPPGRYEIWPLASRADYLAATAAVPPPAPVNVMLTAGHHSAKLTFKPKE